MFCDRSRFYFRLWNVLTILINFGTSVCVSFLVRWCSYNLQAFSYLDGNILYLYDPHLRTFTTYGNRILDLFKAFRCIPSFTTTHITVINENKIVEFNYFTKNIFINIYSTLCIFYVNGTVSHILVNVLRNAWHEISRTLFK